MIPITLPQYTNFLHKRQVIYYLTFYFVRRADVPHIRHNFDYMEMLDLLASWTYWTGLEL